MCIIFNDKRFLFFLGVWGYWDDNCDNIYICIVSDCVKSVVVCL